MPAHDTETELATAVWVPDTVLKTYTQVWEVRKLTNEELEVRAIAEADAADQQLDPLLVKKLMKQALLTTSEKEKKEFIGVYPSWRPKEPVVNQTDSLTGEADIRQWKGELYRCIQSHTT
jgi:hypothetical protein